MAKNFEVRLLLVLWDLGGAAVRKGDLNGRFSGRTQEANEACAELIKVVAIVFEILLNMTLLNPQRDLLVRQN